MFELLLASGILLWAATVVIVFAWVIGLVSGGKRMSWKRLLVAVMLLGTAGWILMLWAAAISASC